MIQQINYAHSSISYDVTSTASTRPQHIYIYTMYMYHGPWTCHVIFGPPKYPDPRNEYFKFSREIFVPPFECVRIDTYPWFYGSYKDV